MSDILVSIIIPVYNAENYIEDVIKDVLSQSYRNLEIIVVNDGSTDNTVSVINRISQNDRRITIIDVEHGGVSNARNLGLKAATGKYIRFIDADDRVPEDSIEKMLRPYQKYSEIDIVIGNFICVPSRNYMMKLEGESEKVNYKKFVNLFSRYAKSFYFGVTWNKLYRREIIDKYHICFDETMPWCEDFVFNIDYFSRCSYFYLLKTTEGIYEYYERAGSITKKIKDDEISQYVSNIRYKKVLEFCEGHLDKEIVTLEWKYAELFDTLSYYASPKRSGKNISEGYKYFKDLLTSEEIYRYICIRIERDNNAIWRSIKTAIERKKYWKVFMVFYIKEFVKAHSFGLEEFIRKRTHIFFPRNF